MIERTTGYVTSSVTCEPKLKEIGFSGECGDPRFSIVTRTFSPAENNTLKGERFPESYGTYDTALFIVRNPFDVVFANYLATDRGTAQKAKEAETGTPFKIPNDFVREQVSNYKRFYNFWANAPVRHIELRIEDLERKPIESWGRLSFFLGAPVSDARIECALHPDDVGMDWTTYSLKSYASLKYFSVGDEKYIIDSLVDELCALDYNSDPELDFDCDEKWAELKAATRARVAAEEAERRREAAQEAEERKKRRKKREMGAVKFWYDGLTKSSDVAAPKASKGVAKPPAAPRAAKGSPWEAGEVPSEMKQTRRVPPEDEGESTVSD